MSQDHDEQQANDQQARDQDGQRSELVQDGPEAISPGDAVAGSPDGESGEAQEGTAGPDAPPRHGQPEPSNESSR
jgi:hypothetical protein